MVAVTAPSVIGWIWIFSVLTTLPVLAWLAALDNAAPGCIALVHSGSPERAPATAAVFGDSAR